MYYYIEGVKIIIFIVLNFRRAIGEFFGKRFRPLSPILVSALIFAYYIQVPLQCGTEKFLKNDFSKKFKNSEWKFFRFSGFFEKRFTNSEKIFKGSVEPLAYYNREYCARQAIKVGFFRTEKGNSAFDENM